MSVSADVLCKDDRAVTICGQCRTEVPSVYTYVCTVYTLFCAHICVSIIMYKSIVEKV